MPRPQSPKGAYNKVFPDKEIKERFFFQVNQTTNKLALYERTENGILHNVDFGSIVTDEFVSTVPMGSLKYRHPDGYDYHVCRVSPTGDSKSAVLGNYASKTYVASNIDGTWLAYENQKQYTKTIQSNETELVTGKTFIVPIETDIDSMAYSIDITVGTGQSSYISRTAWNDLNGKVLYDTISVEAWGGSSNPGWLSDHGAEYVDLSDTSTTLDFAHPFPIVAGEQFKHEVHFKEDVTMLCSKGTNTLVGTINYEELLLEQVASREWVTQRLLGVSVKDVDYEVDTFAQLPTNPTDQNSSGLIIAYVNNSTGVLFAKKKMGYYVY
ncbi:MAG: hypothetical protein GY928_24250, partial [Colwellia sp.]|nr:hypothetical protein [Colwellia sp.]